MEVVSAFAVLGNNKELGVDAERATETFVYQVSMSLVPLWWMLMISGGSFHQETYRS